jgi:MarR family transcriptional regulator for hemolysin
LWPTIDAVAPSPTHDAFFQILALTCGETRRGFDRHVGMSQPRRQLLAVLAEEGEVSHAVLSKCLGVDGAAVTRLVKGLESQGAVVRRLDPRDNRFTLASLTAAGEELVSELRSAHEHFEARLLAGISQHDQEIVMRVLEHVRSNIGQVGQAADPASGA